MDNTTILICDDNEAIHESLRIFLQSEGMACISAYSGEEVFEILQKKHVDLIILDIMLPSMRGTDVCREIRESSDIPIIFLSALGSEADRIVGLKLGADDYVTKPFSPWEVVMRVKAILKRMTPPRPSGDGKLSLAELTVDADAYKVYVNGKRIDLTAKEVEALAFFMKNAGTALTRERILNNVWGYDYYGDMRAVDTLVKRLRQKLPSEGVHFAIRSIYGVGYRMEEVE